MFETPIDKIKYILYKFTQDYSFIGDVPDEIVLKRAESLLKHFETREQPNGYTFYIELKEAIDEHIEHILLNPSV